MKESSTIYQHLNSRPSAQKAEILITILMFNFALLKRQILRALLTVIIKEDEGSDYNNFIVFAISVFQGIRK